MHLIWFITYTVNCVLLLVCGVDDAGRGPLLGPLVIAGVCVKKDDVHKLSRLGVRDSKLHTPADRRRLYHMIKRIAHSHYWVCIPPRSIDASVRTRCLNGLEARYMARVISKLNPDAAYIDSCDVNAARFGQKVSDSVSEKCRVMSYHHADSRFVVVSAASILAKVTRDAAIMRLAKKYPGIGSGYPSDSRSVSFVRSYHAQYGMVPSFVRKSWLTVRRITCGDTA